MDATILLALIAAGFGLYYAYKHHVTVKSVKAEILNLELQLKGMSATAAAEMARSYVEAAILKIKAKL